MSLLLFRYDARLNFKDLNDNTMLNGIQLVELNQMWNPNLAFINALGPFQTVEDDLRFVIISYKRFLMSLDFFSFLIH